MITSGNRLAGPYEGTGALDTYSFSFKVFSKNDISVVVSAPEVSATTLVLDSDYSVALNADQDASPGGTITLLDGNLTVDYLLSIIGNLAYAQSTQLPNGGAYNAAVVEQMADKLAIQIQQVREIANRAMQLPVTAAGVSATLPAIVPGAVFAWNDAGDGIVAMQLTDLDTVLVSAAAANVVSQATLALMRTALGASVVGSAVFTAASEAAARAALGVQGEALTTGGTSSAFTLTPTPAITAYAENQSFDVEFNAASTGTPTLNISGVGAKNLKYRDALGALVSCGTLIPSGWRSKVTYDGTDMIVREMPTAVLTVGQGRMTKVGSDLVFARYQGRFLTANGVIYEIPSGGVTIAPTSNTANTLYYQYAVISGGAISSTGEYSATGYTVGSDGVAYKTGDTSRVLVGMARSGTSGGTWSSVGTEIRSWFNRGSVSATIKKSGANLSCTSSSLAEVDSAFRGGFVCWADDVVSITLASTVGVSTTNTYSNMSLYVDGADWTALPSIQQDYDTTSNSYDRRTSGVGSLSEGHHTAQLWALVTAAHTFTLSGGDFTRFQIEVSG